MKREAVGHTKMKRLCRNLGIELWQAIGLLDSIWMLTAREAPRGDLGKLSNEDIALAIEYRGDETKMIEALVSSGWLDRDPIERLVIHDWHEHAEDTVHRRVARARLTFAGGFVPNLTRLAGKEREQAEKFYGIPDSCARTPPSVRTNEPSVRTACAPPAPTTSIYTSTATTASAQLPQQKSGKWPLTAKAIRRKFPEADDALVLRVATAAFADVERSAIEFSDAVMADAVRQCSKNPRQETAGLFATTVPRCIKSWAMDGTGSQYDEQDVVTSSNIEEFRRREGCYVELKD